MLLVDDSPDDLELVKVAFRLIKAPSRLACVQSGNEAIAYLKGEGKFADREIYPYPGLIISDLKMADGDGFFLLEQMKEKTSSTSWLPVIILSGSADADDVKTAFWLGAASYFNKPSSLDGLKEVVSTVSDYWNLGELPQVDGSGTPKATLNGGKMGARFETFETLENPVVLTAASGAVATAEARQPASLAEEVARARQLGRELKPRSSPEVNEERSKLAANIKVLRQERLNMRALSRQIRLVSHELDVQTVRARKLLKKEPKENFSQAVKAVEPV